MPMWIKLWIGGAIVASLIMWPMLAINKRQEGEDEE